MMSDDMALVREYAQSNSEQAFATLVSRHVNLVYSVALRQVSDHHLAEEISQAVFVILARKGKSLSPKTLLSGWLCRTARNISADTLKIQRRRQFREQEAHMESILNEPEPGVWNQIAPLLDEALNRLGEKEHDAVVLRFFDGKELKQVGAAMGTTEDAARMRVNRGVEKLRGFFTKKGVTLSATAITGAVAANSVQAAPAGLAATITTAALSGTTITTAAVIAATKTIAMTTLQKTLITTALTLAVGTGIYEARQASSAQAEVEALKQEHAPLVREIQALSPDREAATNLVAQLRAKIQEFDRNNAELLRLRGEVSQLPEKVKAEGEDDAMQTEMKSWFSRVNSVKRRFEQNPGATIPEMDFLLPHDWLDATRINNLETDEDYRRAMSGLRVQAATRFGAVVQNALRHYSEANSGHFPVNLSELGPYLKSPTESVVLQRYEIIPAIYLSPDTSGLGDWAIIQKAASDEQADVRIAIGAAVIVQGFRSEIDHALDAAISAFSSANNGQLPKSIHDLKPFVTTPEEQAALKKRLVFDSNRMPPPAAAPILGDAFPHQYQ